MAELIVQRTHCVIDPNIHMVAPAKKSPVLLTRARIGTWQETNQDLWFWICFLLLNALLFVPSYVADMESSSFLPPVTLHAEHPARILVDLFVRRENADVFRLSAELVLLVSLWANASRLRGPLLRAVIFVTYIVILIYHIYESVTVSVYKAEPAFYNQYYLARDGIKFLLRHLHFSAPTLVLGALMVVAGLTVIVVTIRILIRGIAADNLSRGTRVALAGLTVALILSGFASQRAMAQPESVISSLFFKLKSNVEESLRLYGDISAFDDESFRQAYGLDSLDLIEKPNIYLIFVESYGSVLYRRSDYKVAYERLLEELQAELVAGGWQAASTLSESTTWGGGSWLAYTSALFGMPIESHPQYLSMLERFGSSENSYPSLARLLKNQGYHTVWLSSIAEELSDALWLDYRNFYGIDTWMRHSEFEYDGAQYGWGPAPPDQYVLEYARATVVKPSDQPTFLFFITQNSHFPWQVPPLVGNWRALLELDDDVRDSDVQEEAPHQALRMAYMSAVEYELRFLTKSILDTEDEDAIFILIGDHQPPRVSRRNDSFDTPIHIVTRNERVIEALRSHGFQDGLLVADDQTGMKHEGLYSLLRSILAAGYGEVGAVLPAYLPDGVPAVVEDSVKSD